MKPFGKIVEEITVESSVGFEETIAKLREQQGPCSDENSFGVRMWFSCTKKGVIRFTNSCGEYGYSIYFVEGRVVEQNGKTFVKIYSMKNNVEKIYRLITIILGIALIIFVTVQAIKEKSLLRNAFNDFLPQSIIWRKKCPYPKSYDPKYESIVSELLKKELSKKNLFTQIIDKGKLNDFINGENTTWFGQLMGRAQMLAWLYQLSYWLDKYNIIVV